MYSDVFCRVYNQLGWNYYPEAFGEQLLQWMAQNRVQAKSCLDLGCGTGVLCRILRGQGMETSGVDLSESMIAIARENDTESHYEAADMITYRPGRQFDLVTCTGDALNHILLMQDVERIFRNVYNCLNPGGYFIFDILNENEVSSSEPFEMDFTETTRVWFQMTRPGDRLVNLRIRVWENGEIRFEENIREMIHDPVDICRRLERCGFARIQCTDRLLEDCRSSTWYIIAQKGM